MLISGKQGKPPLTKLSPLPRQQRQRQCQHMACTSSFCSLPIVLLMVLILSDAISNALAALDGSIGNVSTATAGDTASITKPENRSHLDLLRMNLFVNYDKNVHPTGKDGVPTSISLGMAVNYIDIEELTGKMTLHSWLRISWTDGNRTWNPEQYDNIGKIHLKPRDVWKPLITLFNSAGNDGEYVGDTQVLLGSDGSFLWVPPAVYTTYCALNLAMWPYDTQTCMIRVGSWTLTYIDYKPSTSTHDAIDYQELVQSTEWEIIDSTPKYVKKDDYNYMEFTFVLKRRSSMYKAIIFTPASCIILLALSVFWLPPQMGEKILLNGIVIVIIGAFLMYFAQLLPILAENTPLVVLFYSSSMVLLSISTIIAVIVLYLSTAKHKKRVPNCIKQLLNGPLGNVLLLSQFSMEAETQSFTNHNTSELTDHVYEQAIVNEPDYTEYLNSSASNAGTDGCDGGGGVGGGTRGGGTDSSQRAIQYSWVLLATAIDRIFFLFYSLIFITLAIIYSV